MPASRIPFFYQTLSDGFPSQFRPCKGIMSFRMGPPRTTALRRSTVSMVSLATTSQIRRRMNAHDLMHGYNMGLASTERPPVTRNHPLREGLSQDQWVDRLRQHYGRPELQHLRGDLRIVGSSGPGETLPRNVSPLEAFEAALEWGA